MDDLRSRFRRVDRVPVPDLWDEAVARAAQPDAHVLAQPTGPLSFAATLAIAGLLLALMAGAIAVWANVRADARSNERMVTVASCTLVVSALEGTSEVRLAEGRPGCAEFDGATQVSGAGDRLAIRTPCGRCIGLEGRGEFLLATVDLATGERWTLETCGPEGGQCVGWVGISPDGSHVAYSRLDAAGVPRLVIRTVEGAETRVLDLYVLPSVEPRWTPDGQGVVISGQAATASLVGRLYHVPLHGEPSIIVEQDGAFFVPGEVSPDGNRVAFVSSIASQFVPEIRVARLDGSDDLSLATFPAGTAAYGPTWSPDGTRIAYTTSPVQMMTGPLRVGVIDVDERSDRLVFQTDEDCCHRLFPATWSPSGEEIRFARRGPSQGGTFAIRVDENAPPRQLSERVVIGWLADR